MPHALVVLDASAALALLLAEAEGSAVEEIVKATISIDGQIFVPGLFWCELGNALLMAERQNRLDAHASTTALSSFAHLPIVTHQDSDIATLNRIIALAQETGLTFYDATYLELALRYEAPLKSFDTHLTNLQASYPSII
jgi:predicted nucleic acid-binding protein